MACVILYRNPATGGVGLVHDGYENPEVYQSQEEAERMARDVPALRAWPYQIVELDEL